MIGVMERNTHVVGRGGDGDRSGAPHVGVAQLVGQLLQLVRLEPVVIPENVIVSWSGGPLDPLVGAEVEVELCRVGDADVHGGAGGDVAALAALLLLVGTEKSEEGQGYDDHYSYNSPTWCDASSGPR